MILCKACSSYKASTEFARSHLNVSGTKGTCRTCSSKKANEYYKANPEAYHKRSAAYTAKHKEIIDEYKRDYAVKHSKRLTSKTALWRKNNADRYKQNTSTASIIRRAHFMRGYIKALSTYDLVMINHYYEAAKVCEKYYKEKYAVDHIIPLNHKLICGLHVPCNLQVLTASDNCAKSNKFIPYCTTANDI